jgi:hypothetical protein
MWIGIYIQKVGLDEYARIQADQLSIFLHTKTRPRVSLFIWRNPLTIEAGFTHHYRAGGIEFQVEVEDVELIKAESSLDFGTWDPVKGFFAFKSPLTENDAGWITFTLEASENADNIAITTIPVRSWKTLQQSITVSRGWRMQKTFGTSEFSVYCRKPGRTMYQLKVRRGIFKGICKIVFELRGDDD